MTRRDIDELVLRLARAQHGAFTWAQATGAGASPDFVARRVRSGAWTKVAPGVYVMSTMPDTWERRLQAALLSLPGSSVSGRSALHLHQLPGGHTGLPQVSVEPGGTFRTPLAKVRRSLLPVNTRVQGFPCVTAEQAVFDIAGHASFAEVERAMDHALLEHRATVDRFQQRLDALTGHRWPGIAAMRALIAERGCGRPVPESELERVLYLVLDQAGVPDVVRQAHPPWSPGDRRRFDALSPSWRTIYEGDGRRWHSRMQDMERDRRRDQEAASHGHLVLRFTWSQLTEGADEAIDVIRAAGRWRAADAA